MLLKDSNLGDLQVRLFGRHKVSLLSSFPLDQEEQLACSKQLMGSFAIYAGEEPNNMSKVYST